MAHDFREQLEYSQQASGESFWDAVYRKAFPGLVGHIAVGGKVQAQYRGVDRLIYLGNDAVLKVDEKKRRRERADILLEHVSVDQPFKPGWIERDLAIDYIAYAFLDSRKVYLLPWPLLRKAWLENGDEWKRKAESRQEGFGVVTAENRGYKTHSVAVPIKRLYAAINRSSIIEVSV